MYCSQMSNANRQPRLDMHHGFLQSIRRNLTVQAEQMSSLPKSVNLKPSSQMDNMSGNENNNSTAFQKNMGMHEEVSDKEHIKRQMISLADLPSYVVNAQPFIRTAIEEPVKLSDIQLGQVAQALVERACEDVGYFDIAAILCGHIAKNDERREFIWNTIPDSRFVRVVLHAIDQRMSDAVQMIKADPRIWENFCLFLGEAYMQMRIKGDPLLELQKVLFKIMQKLSSAPSTENLSEVNTLAMLFKQCGHDLLLAAPEDFDPIICNIRDAYVDGRNKEIRCILLMLVECFACNWQLSSIAKEYYELE